LTSRRQGNADSSAVASGAGGAAATNPAIVLFDDGFGDGKTQAGASSVLGGKERFEDARGHRIGDSVPVIDHKDSRFFPAACDAETECSVDREGIDGIRDQVGNYLQHFARIRPQNRVTGEVLLQLDPLGQEVALMDAQSRFNQG
jgi:hypothetical protein